LPAIELPGKERLNRRGRDGILRLQSLMISRRKFLQVGGTCAVVSGVGLRVRAAAPATDHPLASFDREVQAFMEPRKVPGAALAVVKDGRIVHARGYGWADRERQTEVRPETLFRIASISKPFTSFAIYKLVGQKKLELHTRAFELLDWKPLASAKGRPDPRLEKITIRQLLQHTGGWDRDRSGDPMFRSRAIARAAETESPAMPKTIIRYMLGQALDFDPGTRSVYSNFGYCVLGRVIEKATGQPYDKYMREEILAPMGIKDMCLGASLQSKSGESHYYTRNNATGESVFGRGEKVPEPYGGFCLEAMDSHGGWLASAPALARFAIALDVPGSSPVLSPELLSEMYSPPAPPV
jgi:N-acyl-D-amino-acid deacylase